VSERRRSHEISIPVLILSCRFLFFRSNDRNRKSHKQRVQVADDASDSAPEEVTKVDAKAFAQQEERSRSAAAARASQRVADVKQRRRDVAQQRTAQAVAKRKARAAVPVNNDAEDEVEETPSVAVAAAPARKPNHQFLSDEIIAELARQCVVLCFFCVLLCFSCVCVTYRLEQRG
jgi:hypothetical protein